MTRSSRQRVAWMDIAAQRSESSRVGGCSGSEGLISAGVINYESVSFSKTEPETSSSSAPVSFQEVWMKGDSVHSWSAASSVTLQINAFPPQTHTHSGECLGP